MMLIKNRLFFLIILESIHCFGFLFAAEFNPEQYEFSKKETILSWLAPEFCDPEKVSKIQYWIANEMPQNTEALKRNNVLYLVKNNDGDKQFFGKTFYVLAAVQLQFLQNIRACCDQNKNPVVVEIGAAGGFFAFKMLLALGNQGTLVVNDKSSYEVEKAKVLFAKRTDEIGHTIDNVIFDAGDVTYFLDRNSQLSQKIDLCYVQNVEHFMNPTQHQAFLKTALTMLASSGNIFCTANTILFGYGTKGHPYFEMYIALKKQLETYPMFLKTINIAYQSTTIKRMFSSDYHLEQVAVPLQDDVCSARVEDLHTTVIKNDHVFKMVKQICCNNYFTPTIYTNAFQKAAQNLGVLIEKKEAFFMDNVGEKYASFDRDQVIQFASIIVEKK